MDWPDMGQGEVWISADCSPTSIKSPCAPAAPPQIFLLSITAKPHHAEPSYHRWWSKGFTPWKDTSLTQPSLQQKHEEICRVGIIQLNLSKRRVFLVVQLCTDWIWSFLKCHIGLCSSDREHLGFGKDNLSPDSRGRTDGDVSPAQ